MSARRKMFCTKKRLRSQILEVSGKRDFLSLIPVQCQHTPTQAPSQFTAKGAHSQDLSQRTLFKIDAGITLYQDSNP